MLTGLDGLADPCLVCGTDGRITASNPAASAWFGSPEDFLGRSAGDLLPFLDAPATGTITLEDRSGVAHEVDVVRVPISEGWLYVLHDVSAHIALARSREQLLYTVAHELRGALAVLDNALDLLQCDQDGLSNDDMARVVGAASRAARRLGTVMEGLLNAGSIQSGSLMVHPRSVAVSDLLTVALEAVEATVAGRSQRVIVDPSTVDVSVLADPLLAPQVLINLLANASKYSPVDADIQVTAEGCQGMCRLTVIDRGPGIPSEEVSLLFDRFYRAAPAHEQPGVGLGLAITKGIVEAHGGKIGIVSEVGSGTSVWFTLPLAEGARANPAC
jgi:signal transduction histidine kinase